MEASVIMSRRAISMRRFLSGANGMDAVRAQISPVQPCNLSGLIYAYHTPKSAGQQQYAAQRLVQLREQQRKQADERKAFQDSTTIYHLERSLSNETERATFGFEPGSSAAAHHQAKDRHRRANSYGDMEVPRANLSPSSSSSSHSEQGHQYLLSNPFELRHGRRYLREVCYPLPCDLAEIQRQNLRTLLGCRVFGRAVCSPHVTNQVPRRVLEIGCGSGFWSATCHDYFCSLGHKNVSFTGLDVAPLAPDLKRQGLNWTFVQHDIRRIPLPFDDGDFDLIMLKDLSLILPLGVPFQKFLDETIRILQVGGTLEIWESDHVLRSLLPHPPPPTSKQPQDQEIANSTATFLIAPGTPFAPAQNKYLQDANTWVTEALDRRRLPPTPCARIAQVLYQEPETLGDVGIRRVAIPLGEFRWERETARNQVLSDSPLSNKGKGPLSDKPLTIAQSELRQTALLTVLQMIESLEPLLKETSGKNSEEWSHWWALMMADLLDPSRGALTGECLEVGAWWATKLAEE